MRNWVLGSLMAVSLVGTSGAQEPSLTSVEGVVLPVPEISGLTCERVQELLFRYQASGYRQPGTIPVEGTDVELFVYEDALARHNYETCLLSSYDFANPTEAFVQGFN